MFERIVSFLQTLDGWRKSAVLIVAGAIAAMAQAPFYLLPVLLISFPVLILILDADAAQARPLRRAFLSGWSFGFGYFLVGLYWLAFSFFVQAEQFAWMAPFAVTGMPAFLALFMGAASTASVKMRVAGWRRILVFVLFWSLAEYARGHVLTGLPWNLFGQSFAAHPVLAQLAAYVGVYGLGLIVLLVACAPAAAGGAKRGFFRGVGASLAIVVAVACFGAVRVAMSPTEPTPGVSLRIVQANIPQKEKIDPTLWRRNVDRHLVLSEGVSGGVDKAFVIWPENAAPILNEAEDALRALDRILPDNAVLVTGAVRRQNDPDSRLRYYNSIGFFAKTPDGRRAAGFYDKHHLVPFGEYLPMQGVLRAVGLAQLAPFEDGFTPGAGPATIDLGGPRFAPLICYETIFPGDLYPRGERPDFLLTVTNDAWFGDSAGPRQHLDQARLRSIETGLPMARAANTGVSAIIDPVGRYLNTIPLYKAGVIDHYLPKALKPTLYARFGDWTYALFWIAIAATAVWPAINRGKARHFR